MDLKNNAMQFATHRNSLNLKRGESMSLSWEDFFTIVEEMWELNQKEVAGYLGCKSSTITRIRNGETKKPRITIEQLYEKLFDPTNENSPTYGKKEKDIWADLIKIIKNAESDGDIQKGVIQKIENFIEIIKNAGSEGARKKKIVIQEIEKKEDYKTFVMELIRLTKINQPPKEKPKDKKDDPSEAMREIFKQAYNDYRISDFSSQYFFLVSLTPKELLDGIDGFIKTIEFEIIEPYSYANTEEIYKNIYRYIEILRRHKYDLETKIGQWRDELMFHGISSHSSDVLNQIIPINSKGNDVGKIDTLFKDNRKKLEKLYNLICCISTEQ